MKKLTKLTALMMALVMALSLMTVAAFADEEEELAGGRMPIGSTPYSIEVPAGFYDDGVTREDIAEGMISTFVSDDTAIAFDIYEIKKDEANPTLEAFMEKDCAEWNGTELTLDGVINGVTMTSYRSNDEYNGKTYSDMNYAFEYGDKIVEIDFYWQDPALEGVAEEIMSTFKLSGMKQIPFGASGYSVMISSDFAESEITGEDYETGLLRAWSNQYTGLEIETYYFPNEAGATLEEAVAAQAAAYNGTVLSDTEINGIPMGEYVATQTYGGVEYNVYVILVQDDTGAFSAMAFYLNNYSAYVQAEACIDTLAVYDEMKDVPLEPMTLQLGSSGYQITLPFGFVPAHIAQEEFDEDGLIATYHSPYSDLQFDVYQCAKAAEESDQLAEFTELDAAKYDGTGIDLTAEFNGIPVTTYASVETYDDVTYNYMNYTFEAQDFYFVQVCFYWQDNDCADDAEMIMNTLQPVETKEITLGGAYKLTVAEDTEINEVEDEWNGSFVTYCVSETGAPTIIAYDIENADKLSLEAYVEADCETFGGKSLNFGENGNGVTLGGYRVDCSTPDTDEMYDVFSTFVENGGHLLQIDLVITSYAQYMQAMDILSTLKAA